MAWIDKENVSVGSWEDRRMTGPPEASQTCMHPEHMGREERTQLEAEECHEKCHWSPHTHSGQSSSFGTPTTSVPPVLGQGWHSCHISSWSVFEEIEHYKVPAPQSRNPAANVLPPFQLGEGKWHRLHQPHAPRETECGHELSSVEWPAAKAVSFGDGGYRVDLPMEKLHQCWWQLAHGARPAVWFGAFFLEA